MTIPGAAAAPAEPLAGKGSTEDGLVNPIDDLARRILGVAYLFPYQKLVVANVLDRRDQIVILPTGAGKSLCFQLPSQLLPGATVVVLPLLALIADQARRLAAAGTPCGCIRGGQETGERTTVWEQVRSGTVKLLLATPEALISPSVADALSRLPIAQLVVDEAHCVSEWGETFRPSYLQLGRVAATMPLVTAFTATASPLVLGKIRSILFADREVTTVVANPDRPNISYAVLPTLSKENELLRLARSVERPALIFCRSRVGAELTARRLRGRLADERVLFYHAGLSREEKKRVEGWFFASSDGILAATCAYGLGIDKAGIRTVIHRDVPPSVEAFLQESGRAGRDKEAAASYLLLSEEDLAHEEHIDDPVAKSRYRALLDFARNSGRCRREALLALLGAEPEVCFGCDVCRGSVRRLPPGERELLQFVGANRRRHTPVDAALVLFGRRSYEIARRGLGGTPGFGRLAGWERADIEEAIENLVRRGALRLGRRGPWKRRLTTGRRARRCAEDLPHRPSREGA